MIIAIKYYTLVSGQDWAREFVTFGLYRLLVSAISRTETGITSRYLEITSSSFGYNIQRFRGRLPEKCARDNRER